MTQHNKEQLISLFNAGISAVSGRDSVINAHPQNADFKPDLIIAVGKAASGMCEGALDCFPDTKALVITKYDHSVESLIQNPNVTIFESAHPIPDENSLKAGEMLIKAVSELDENQNLLLLVSGGASSLAESLPDDLSLSQLQKMTDEMVSGGLAIGQINKKRKEISQIKGGKLLENFNGKSVLSYAISDVQGDDIAVIGSGIGDINLCSSPAEVKLIATNHIARTAVEQEAIKQGLTVKSNVEALYNDVFKLCVGIGKYVNQASAGIYIWGGEPTIILPENPGSGGRNQALALGLAKVISGKNNITILVAGTDGSDGPTNAAGGIIDGTTFHDETKAMAALEAANSGEYLRATGDIFITGPTGTNVMDLVIVKVE